MVSVIEPQNKTQWDDYYAFRWQLLREPWQQPLGSEKDELEEVATHKMVMLDDQVVGVGRLHKVDSESAQIRYMAVHGDYSGQHIGTALMNALEQSAQHYGVKTIILHSRESAIGFYLKNGFELGEKTHTLYGEIPHYFMQKHIELP